MAFHIVMNRPIDIDALSRGADQRLNPRHSMVELAAALDARVHDGTGLTPSWSDRMLARVTPIDRLWWAIAREVRGTVAPGDVVFCTGEDVGLPVAMLCGGRLRARVAIMAHSVDSPKKRAALALFSARRRVSMFASVCERQAHALRRYMGKRADRVSFIWDQTDTSFFTPGVESVHKRRATVVSVGLERRDYGTLAVATADLDVDVKISGFSADTRAMSHAFPKVLPSNMTRRFYSWVDLVQLYRDADIVVISLFPNEYAAGVQALMEALSCGRPVVITSTAGLREYLEDNGAVRIVPPGDADRMRQAIKGLLDDRDARIQLSSSALQLARSRHACERYVDTLVEKLQALHEDSY